MYSKIEQKWDLANIFLNFVKRRWKNVFDKTIQRETRSSRTFYGLETFYSIPDKNICFHSCFFVNKLMNVRLLHHYSQKGD